MQAKIEQIEFNENKCEVLHFGRLNARGKYTVNGGTLRQIYIQLNLGVQFHGSLKMTTWLDRVVNSLHWSGTSV